MQEIITNSLMTFGAGFATAALSKAQGPGQALDDIMTLVGFEKLHDVAERKRAKRELNVQQYKESIAQKIATIPEENLQEPSLAIVGPALEASKYYIEEEALREMFAQLIASSMNSEKQDFVHPSFVEVIKQLTFSEAKFIKEAKGHSLPIASILQVTKEEYLYDEPEEEIDEDEDDTRLFKKLKKIRIPNLEKKRTRFIIENYYTSSEFKDFEENQLIISNLERLGLIKISDKTFSDNSFYDYIQDSYNQLLSSEELIELYSDPEFEYKLQKKVIDFTPFGFSFFNACVIP